MATTKPGKIVAVGDVIIVEHRGRYVVEDRHVVTKVARVWITVISEDAVDSPYPELSEKRFRLDDQTQGGDFAYMSRFYTLAQWETRQLQDRASTFLRDQGIDIRRDSPWYGRTVELADLLAAHTARTAEPKES